HLDVFAVKRRGEGAVEFRDQDAVDLVRLFLQLAHGGGGLAARMLEVVSKRFRGRHSDLRLFSQAVQKLIGSFAKTLPETGKEREKSIDRACEHTVLGGERCDERGRVAPAASAAASAPDIPCFTRKIKRQAGSGGSSGRRR